MKKIFISLLLMLIPFIGNTEEYYYPNFPKVGEKFRDLTLPDVQDKMLKLSDYCGKGHYTLLTFGQHGFGICSRDLRSINMGYHFFKSANLDVVSVVILPFRSDRYQYMLDPKTSKDPKYPWPLLVAYEEDRKLLKSTYGIKRVPIYFLLDPKGIIIEIGIGVLFPNKKYNRPTAEASQKLYDMLKQMCGFDDLE